MVDDDEAKARILRYLYRTIGIGAYWGALFWEMGYSPGVGVYGVPEVAGARLWRLLDELVKEGKATTDGNRTWFRLTAAQWLRMTRSKQQCLTTSTSI